MVSADFHLPFDGNCLAFTIISTPDMFENAFIPYIRMRNTADMLDPINHCMKHYLNKLCMTLSRHSSSVEVIHDFDLQMPNRRPKVLAQTAAHVSGAAFYYKPDVISADRADGRAGGERSLAPLSPSTQPSPSLSSKLSHSPSGRRLLGYCIHPEFGGWFAIRAVLVLADLTADWMIQRSAKDVLPSVKQRIELLTAFNTNWHDWSAYRDVIAVTKRYSDLQIQYFQSSATDRRAILNTFIDCHKSD
ncbi:unnamed protein product [Medioppia subpectinata]|uniref:Cyanocobalamin reductase (cyanide-eliminating) n=1 Tax=Medioppia subpectinata TaxID=1979941 RepID=A0A7R9LCZ5_9ACAR|nr:unnamed protein product [Medioppia subpectinata]CAG2117389.1 unnamed protein product [Medioppia subpectinata]